MIDDSRFKNTTRGVSSLHLMGEGKIVEADIMVDYYPRGRNNEQWDHLCIEVKSTHLKLSKDLKIIWIL